MSSFQTDSIYRAQTNVGGSCSNIKELVGEVDFSFHVISTSDSSEDALLSDDRGKGKTD